MYYMVKYNVNVVHTYIHTHTHTSKVYVTADLARSTAIFSILEIF